MRMHGRHSWYNYKYSDKEISDVYNRIAELKPTYISDDKEKRKENVSHYFTA